MAEPKLALQMQGRNTAHSTGTRALVQLQPGEAATFVTTLEQRAIQLQKKMDRLWWGIDYGFASMTKFERLLTDISVTIGRISGDSDLRNDSFVHVPSQLDKLDA